MDPTKLLDMQVQMRRNQEDLAEYLRDMESWEKDIKVKEEQLASQPITKDPVSLPPVRNSLSKKILKKKKKKTSSESAVSENKPRRIRGNDYKSWDRFDVDKACAEVDVAEEHRSSSSEYETDEEMEDLRQKQLASILKDEGNQFFKKEEYGLAIERYSQGLQIDSENIILLLNRAMALLKQERYAVAEQDCTKAILLGTKDPKAWFRRGSARESLKRYEESLADFEEVLRLDSRNKVAQGRIDAVRNILNPRPPSNIIKAVYIPPEKRSKKPLRRVPIEEIGVDNEEQQSYHKNAKTNQPTDFDRFLNKNVDVKTEQTFVRTSNIVPLISEIGDHPKLDKSEGLQKTKFQGYVVENSRVAQGMDVDGEAESCRENLKKDENASRNVLQSEESRDVSRREKSEESSQSTTVKSELPFGAEESRAESKQATFLVPKNSCQFQAHWKVLRKKEHDFYVYFRQIDPKDYRSLFTVAFDDELLTKILSCLHDFYVCEGLDVFPVLDQLTRVQRFSTIIMFLSPKYKHVLKVLFKHMESTGKSSETELKSLGKLYEL